MPCSACGGSSTTNYTVGGNTLKKKPIKLTYQQYQQYCKSRQLYRQRHQLKFF